MVYGFIKKLPFLALWPTADVIPVFLTGRPVIIKWSDYSTFDIPTVAEYLSDQLWELNGNVKCTVITQLCDNEEPRYENKNHSCCWLMGYLQVDAI